MKNKKKISIYINRKIKEQVMREIDTSFAQFVIGLVESYLYERYDIPTSAILLSNHHEDDCMYLLWVSDDMYNRIVNESAMHGWSANKFLTVLIYNWSM